jgi:probable rRNA maturation factor
MPTNLTKANLTEAKLQLLAKKIFSLLNQRTSVVDIFLLPHAEIKALKAKFIKKKNEPNVLSFREPLGFPHPELKGSGRSARKKYLGEIYLNQNILAKSPERTAPLLLHGILHLMGHDHEKKAEIAKMEDLEAEILKKL